MLLIQDYKEMLPNFIFHIQKFVHLNPEEIETILNTVKSFSLKKKEFLLTEGEICKYNYFVEEGCLRMFFINEKGNEQITQFAIETWWMADYMSFHHQSVSGFFIQAVEKAQVFAISFAQQDELFDKVPQLERYFRLVFQKAYAASQHRLKFIHDFSKEEGYRHFSSNFPQFIQRIPQYMLASYLGFTPEYLSEIRKKI